MGELAIFTQQIASLLRRSAAGAVSRSAAGPDGRSSVSASSSAMCAATSPQGNSFSSAVKKFPNAFNTLFVSMVEAGEASGGLAEILAKVAGYFESTVKLTKKVKSAMTYPIAVIGLAVALVNVLLIFVIPVFAAMLRTSAPSCRPRRSS
jgi:type IV pilus assembly protein PilC